ncbi:MAG: lytic transglycosylase domain-containing protein [Actinobacteria bacterium]|nr:MAG: lytic transglycosylase domain-containing protein [Actinomycetota bacterium]
MRLPVRLRVLVLALVVASTAAASSSVLGRASSGPATPVAVRHDPACPLPSRYRGAFELAARDTALPLPLLVAVARVESRVDQHARSSRGAQGILQVLPSTAHALGLDASSARANVLAGARYLRQLLDRFGSPDLALAAYNAGPAAVERSGGAPSGQTVTYVANVTDTWRSLHGCT